MLRYLFTVLICTILITVAFPAPTPAATGGNRLWLVRIAATPAEATRLERLGVDLVETRAGPDVLALCDDRQIRALQSAGWDVRPQRIVAGPGASRPATFRDGYRTVADVTELLATWNTSYPGLVEIEQYGVTWEREQQAHLGYDLLALRLTDESVGGPKARLVVMAAIHARELVTTEIVLRWAEELLAGFTTDPAITTLLRTREIWLIPLANPDGRIRAQQGIYWRKNINDIDAPCAESPSAFSQPGVDLNRNSSWQWGVIDSPETDPCAQTFPGPEPVSEPEVEAIQALLTRLFLPRENETDAAGCEARRRDTPGLFISLHSYGELVLYPWGYTDEPACMRDELGDLAGRFAAFNGYQTGQPPALLYSTSGTTDDWAYGALGIASYTFEIGPNEGTCGDFFPPFDCVDDFYAINRGALMHAAEVADNPFGADIAQTDTHYLPLDLAMMFEPLPRDFFAADTLAVTRRLLGQRLVRRLDGELLAGRIVEAEAYGGREDSTSHAYRGPTPRAAGMFGPTGRSYVYLIYGMYSCLNVVAHPPGDVGAILIRALVPEQGIERMQVLRGDVKPPLIASGPGRLCKALGIDRSLNDIDLCDAAGPLFLAQGDPFPDVEVMTTPRIGVRGRPDDILLPWRFVVADGPTATRVPARAGDHATKRGATMRPEQAPRDVAAE